MAETCRNIGADSGSKSSLHSIDHSRKHVDENRNRVKSNGSGAVDGGRRSSGHSSDHQSPPNSSTPDKSALNHNGSRPNSSSQQQTPSRPNSRTNSTGPATAPVRNKDANKPLSFKPYEESGAKHSEKDRLCARSPAQRAKQSSPKSVSGAPAHSAAHHQANNATAAAAAAAVARDQAAKAAALNAAQLQQQQLMQYQYQQYLAAFAGYAGTANPFLAHPSASHAMPGLYGAAQAMTQSSVSNLAATTTTTSSSGSSMTTAPHHQSAASSAAAAAHHHQQQQQQASSSGNQCPPGCMCAQHSSQAAANSALSSFNSAHLAALTAQYPNISPHLLNMYAVPGYSPLGATNPASAAASALAASSQQQQPPQPQASPAVSASTSKAAADAARASPSQLKLPHICHWPLATGQCAKRFASSDELLLHSRSHVEQPIPGYEQLYASATAYEQLLASPSAGLRRTAFDPIAPTSRFHPYSKPNAASSSPVTSSNGTASPAYHAAAVAAAASNPLLSPLSANPLAASAALAGSQFAGYPPFAALGAFGGLPGSIPSFHHLSHLNPHSLAQMNPSTAASNHQAAAAAVAAYNMYGAYAAGRVGPPVQP